MAFDDKLTTTIGRTVESLLGDRLGALTFGLKGDGKTDDAPALNAAIVDCNRIGGRAIYFPAGYTFLLSSPVTLLSNVQLIGEGYGSAFLRGADMPAGQGVFNIAGVNCGLRNVSIDGDVTTITQLQYGGSSTLPQFSNDPMSATLTKNTSIWIQPGTGGITIDGVTIEHTGGYAILLDARTADIADVRITGCSFQNNRPHSFGDTLGDLIYGSWTGGIHFQGHCVSPALSTVKGLLVDGCTFARNSGNQVWGHAYGFDAMHTHVRITNNAFLDIGLDCIQSAVTSSGIVAGNIGRRIGYMCADDTSASVPRWTTKYAVFLDTSGTTGVNYIGNSAVSVLGGFIDLDGFSNGSVSGNVCRVPKSGDPEYTEDLIASWPGTPVVYGIQCANNYYEPGGRNISITDNTLINCAAGAIRLFAARGCHIAGNNISHPAAATFPPIMLGNFNPASGSGTVHSVNNDITGNNIQWAPGTAKGAVQEIENWGVGSIPWTAGEVNWAADNRIFGALTYEFDRAASSSSITGSVISSQGTGLSAGAHVILSREKTAGVNYTSMYGPSGDLHWRFYDAIGQLNVSQNGSAGSVTTGPRTGPILINDTVATGHLYADGFLALADTTYAGADADAFNGNYGLIRFNSGSGVFQASKGVSAGHRVWATLATTGSSTVAGSDTQVQFNSSGSFGASSNLTWDGTYLTSVNGTISKTFTSTADSAGSPSTTGAFQTTGGNFVIYGDGHAAFQSVTLTTRLSLANGGTGSGGTTSQVLVGGSTPAWGNVPVNALNGGSGASSSTYWRGDGTWASVSGGSPAGSSTQVQFNSSGSFGASSNLTWDGTYLTSVNGTISKTFTSTADSAGSPSTTGAFQTVGGNFVIYGDGHATFQSVAVTSGMTIGGAAVATQSYVTGQGYITGAALSGYATTSYVTSQGYITSSALSGYATTGYADNIRILSQGDSTAAFLGHLAFFHGGATAHSHSVSFSLSADLSTGAVTGSISTGNTNGTP